MNAKDHLFKFVFRLFLDFSVGLHGQFFFCEFFALESSNGSDLIFNRIKGFNSVNIMLGLACVSTTEGKYIVEVERCEILVQRELHVFNPVHA